MPRHFSVKEAVFPFVKFPGVDTLLGPEMKSTGEVMGIDSDFGRAFAKAQIQAGNSLPDARARARLGARRGPRRDRAGACASSRRRASGARHAGHRGVAGRDRRASRRDACRRWARARGELDTVGRIEAGDVDLVINTVGSDPTAVRDSASIRRTALLRGLPYFTTVAAARAGAGAIRALQSESIGVRSLQEIHRAGRSLDAATGVDLGVEVGPCGCLLRVLSPKPRVPGAFVQPPRLSPAKLAAYGVPSFAFAYLLFFVQFYFLKYATDVCCSRRRW